MQIDYIFVALLLVEWIQRVIRVMQDWGDAPRRSLVLSHRLHHCPVSHPSHWRNRWSKSKEYLERHRPCPVDGYQLIWDLMNGDIPADSEFKAPQMRQISHRADRQGSDRAWLGMTVVDVRLGFQE